MPLKDIVKVNRKTFFNPSAWLGFGQLSSQFRNTVDLAKGIVTPEQARRQETFDQAMSRLRLTDKDVHAMWVRYLLYTLFFFVLGTGLLVYGFYLLIENGSFHGFILALAIASLAFVNAFRFHFLSFQIRRRQLGCTFKEYFRQLVNFTGGKTDD